MAAPGRRDPATVQPPRPTTWTAPPAATRARATLEVDVYVKWRLRRRGTRARSHGDLLGSEEERERAARRLPVRRRSGRPRRAARSARAAASTCAASTRPPSRSRAATRRADKTAVAALATELDGCRTCSTPTGASSCWSSSRAPTRAARTAPSAASSAQTSALGVHTVGWKAPSEEERAHDYLWRIHQRCRGRRDRDLQPQPLRGRAGAGGQGLDRRRRRPQQRYAHINDFERMLSETGTVVLKFLLHISKDEQRAAPAGAARRPDQALEVRGRRPRGAQALGRLPGGLRGGDRRHRHAVGAVDHRAGRLEDASQPDDRDAPSKQRCSSAEAALSAGRPGARRTSRST